MKALSTIAYKVKLKQSQGDPHAEVKGLTLDSRQVKPGFLFAAIRGVQTDGHDYIGAAIGAGASAVVCQRLPKQVDPAVTYLQVEDAAKALGQMAANFYDNPAQQVRVVAVTGTNGKTTVASLLYQLFTELGYTCGLLSTIGNRIGQQQLPATHTTPNSVAIQALLADMKAAGCQYCFMEASSHALVQERLSGLQLAGALFTNLTHDHLDYHGTMDNYIAAKKKLFDELPKEAFALVNADDKRGKVMLQNCKALVQKSYSLRTMADYRAKVLSNDLSGLELDMEGTVVHFRLAGEFNAYNLLLAYGTAVQLGEEPTEALAALSKLEPVEGRLEVVPNALGILAVVDYAHTPDALENVLRTINGFRTGNEQLYTVVGAGGDRDKDKRPKMAEIACRLSNRVIFTSDNPRTEDPEAILRDMEAGVPPQHYKKTLKIADRKEAIKSACLSAEKGDIVLVAGKGHETYQEVHGVRHHFDDREILSQLLSQA